MSRLQSELHRLYLPMPGTAETAGVRAMVMELAAPPNWAALSGVWRGVQSELELPAPGIAVSGTDGIQLWFSLAEPVSSERAHEFLELLRSSFMPDVDGGRVRLMTALQAAPVPALQQWTGNWSAFIASDLAPVFAETPWLDFESNEEGQAALLRGLEAMKAPAFEAAFKRLSASAAPVVSDAEVPAATRVPAKLGEPGSGERPDAARRFLLQVMDDESAPLALRVEAAKALLAHSTGR